MACDFLLAPAATCGETAEQQFWYFNVRAMFGTSSTAESYLMCKQRLGADEARAFEWYADRYGEIDHTTIEGGRGSQRGVRDAWWGNDAAQQSEERDWINFMHARKWLASPTPDM
jgi:hypothetical protein